MDYIKVLETASRDINNTYDENLKNILLSILKSTEESPKPTFSFFKRKTIILNTKDIAEKIIQAEVNYYTNKYSYEIYYTDNINCNLSSIIRLYYNFKSGVEVKQNKYKLYPCQITHNRARRIHEEIIESCVKEHLETSEELEEIIKRKTNKLKETYEEEKKKLVNSPMEPYYGDPTFIIERIRFIINCAKNLANNDNFEKILSFVDNWESEHEKIREDYRDKYIDSSTQFKYDYEQLERTYLNVLEIEKKIQPIVNEKWQTYLTDPNTHKDENFKYLVHAFTAGPVPPDKIDKMCCLLVTSRLLPVPFSSWGVICEYDGEKIDNICCEDADSWSIDKAKFIQDDLPRTWQLTNPESNSVFYGVNNLSKLLLPEEVEKSCIQNNIKNNKSILNYNVYSAYSEIYMKKPKIKGVFYTDTCNNIEIPKKYAEEYNLPLIHLSLKKQQEIYGMTLVSNTNIENNYKKMA